MLCMPHARLARKKRETPGTELMLRLTAPIEVRSSARRSVGITSFSPDEVSAVHHLLKGSAQRARMGSHPSDLVNLLFLGSREEVDRAFHAAGWSQAERKSPLSLYRMYQSPYGADWLQEGSDEYPDAKRGTVRFGIRRAWTRFKSAITYGCGKSLRRRTFGWELRLKISLFGLN